MQVKTVPKRWQSSWPVSSPSPLPQQEKLRVPPGKTLVAFLMEPPLGPSGRPPQEQARGQNPVHSIRYDGFAHIHLPW